MGIKHFIYDSGHNGSQFLITGAIHGNEICGPIAIEWLRDLIDTGRIRITKGTLTLIPICNPRAYDEKVRFSERNLNRYFFPKDNPVYYEDELQNALSPFFEKTDILLDLHSYHSQGDAFAFVSPDKEQELNFATMFGLDIFLHGFGSGYDDPKEAMGTTEYTRLHGGYGVTVECGQHDDPASVDAAKTAILGALYHLGVVDMDDDLKAQVPAKRSTADIRWMEVKHVYKRTRAGKLNNLSQFQPVSKGETLASYDDGEVIESPMDGYVVFPKESAIIDEEWFYVAQ